MLVAWEDVRLKFTTSCIENKYRIREIIRKNIMLHIYYAYVGLLCLSTVKVTNVRDIGIVQHKWPVYCERNHRNKHWSLSVRCVTGSSSHQGCICVTRLHPRWTTTPQGHAGVQNVVVRLQISEHQHEWADGQNHSTIILIRISSSAVHHRKSVTGRSSSVGHSRTKLNMFHPGKWMLHPPMWTCYTYSKVNTSFSEVYATSWCEHVTSRNVGGHP